MVESEKNPIKCSVSLIGQVRKIFLNICIEKITPKSYIISKKAFFQASIIIF